MTVTKPPAAQAGSYRVGDLDLNRLRLGPGASRALSSSLSASQRTSNMW
jgi:hypothetical protein